jgi:hypothetical protein
MTSTQRFNVPVDQIRELAAKGHTDREIGLILGFSAHLIGDRRREANILPGVGAHGKRQVDIERVRELAALGWSDRLIGVELGRTENVIRARRQEAGIEPANPKKRHTYPTGNPKDEALSGFTSVRKADEEFARRIGSDRFEDVKLRQTKGAVVSTRPSSDDRSLTGCAASMCAS